MYQPVFVVIQGVLNGGAEETYAEYVKRVVPLLNEYGVETVGVGAGFESPHTNMSFPVNFLLKIESQEKFEEFFADPRYAEAKVFRDAAYKELRLSVFQGRPPKR